MNLKLEIDSENDAKFILKYNSVRDYVFIINEF